MREPIDVKPLIKQLSSIHKSMLRAEETFDHLIRAVQPHYRRSARNLVHYLALRTFDLRDIQWQLSSLAISSIGHSERYTLSNLQNILYLLRMLRGQKRKTIQKKGTTYSLDFPRGKEKLERHTLELFGPERHSGHTRIMVTLPPQAADDYELVRSLVEAGMAIARINCAHDNPEIWLRMIGHLEKAREETGSPCMLYMDLEGPKLRTGPLPPRISQKGNLKPGRILLRRDDPLILMREPDLGTPAEFDELNQLIAPGRISITLPGIFDDLREGHPIWFDDGRIGGILEEVHPDHAVVRITAADDEGSNLGGEKGINLPETDLNLPSLSAEDKQNLGIIVRHADMVGYSFVRRPSDVEELQAELDRLERPDIGIILKIETRETFDNLPMLLLTGMRSQKVGVMIARGDLAVELGFLRIAEVQEQIMWLCDAAHIPTIWATQILENMVKTGLATRAEISDAVMSVRAECAMLNKGPHILEAVKTLVDIDRRMASHQLKKQSSLRPLNVARKFFSPSPEKNDLAD